MALTVRLPFWSDGALVTVTQEPREGSHRNYAATSWDFALGITHRVRAIADGEVVDTRETVPDGDASQPSVDSSWGSGGIGNFVTLRHEIDGQAFYSSYFHLRENYVPVEIGDIVSAGQEIGQVGNTGIRTGTHLHLQVGTESIWFGSTRYGWPADTENGGPQLVADGSATEANANLITFDGYGEDLPGQVIGPPVNAPDLPDLSVEDFSASATVVARDGTLDFTWSIANTGIGAQEATAHAGIYLSLDDSITTDDILLHQETFMRLQAAGRDDDEFQNGIELPDDLAPGTYWLGVIADNRGAIAESDEANNLSEPIEIVITPFTNGDDSVRLTSRGPHDAGAGNDRVIGTARGDSIDGKTGRDQIYGRGGADDLSGGGGSDRLDGGRGRDRIEGGAGNDTLRGQGGADSFVFALGDGRDRIRDFQDDTDSLILSADLWGGRDLSARQVLNRFGTDTGDHVQLDFGDGGRILIRNLATLQDLQDDLVLV